MRYFQVPYYGLIAGYAAVVPAYSCPIDPKGIVALPRSSVVTSVVPCNKDLCALGNTMIVTKGERRRCDVRREAVDRCEPNEQDGVIVRPPT